MKTIRFTSDWLNGIHVGDVRDFPTNMADLLVNRKQIAEYCEREADFQEPIKRGRGRPRKETKE